MKLKEYNKIYNLNRYLLDLKYRNNSLYNILNGMSKLDALNYLKNKHNSIYNKVSKGLV